MPKHIANSSGRQKMPTGKMARPTPKQTRSGSPSRRRRAVRNVKKASNP